MTIGASKRRRVVWAASVGVVLADSSIVTLALPEILREYDTTVFGVSWVLTAFNLVLAAAVLPASRLARKSPGRTWALGLVIFTGASLGCALAPSVASLLTARLAQALGGAAVITGAIELLAGATGSHRAAAHSWGLAGTAGLALGPAVGGLLTELFSWQSIFLVQAPLVLALVVAPPRGHVSPQPGAEGSLELAPEAGLALLSAGLTGALFLLVVMLTEGWGLSPIAAAAVVSAMPAATLLVRALPERLGSGAARAAAGTIVIVAGLVALAVLPAAAPVLTVAPQMLIGTGLALALPVLTAAALAGRDPHGHRAAGTIAARHAGIVVGIVVLTPLLSSQLGAQHDAARRAETALMLDARLDPVVKLDLARAIADQIDAAGGRLPDLSPAFDAVDPGSADAGAYAQLQREMNDELERASTHAFSLPFLGAAVIAALALIPLRRPAVRA